MLSGIIEKSIKKPTLSAYLKGSYEAKQDNVYTLAKILNVSEAWLMGYDVPMEKEILPKMQQNPNHNEPNQYVLDLYNSLSPEAQKDTVSYMRALKLVNKPNRSKIQILGQTAAGQPIEYGDSYAQDVEDVEHIPKGADYALTVNGDSMEPVIKNGQVIYIKAKPDVEDGTIAVVEIDGAVTCKKVYKWKDHIELQSLNTKYEPIIITGGNFRILGEVLLNK